MIELLDVGCKAIADMIKGKTPEQVRQTFNIPNDLPPTEVNYYLDHASFLCLKTILFFNISHYHRSPLLRINSMPMFDHNFCIFLFH